MRITADSWADEDVHAAIAFAAASAQEDLPVAGTVNVLAALGHDVDTVPEEKVAGRDDDVLWAAAQAAGRFLITQDLDFSDARKYAPGTHHGLLLRPTESTRTRSATRACQFAVCAGRRELEGSHRQRDRA